MARSLGFFFWRSCAPRDLHSFPTRRSSDLLTKAAMFLSNGTVVQPADVLYKKSIIVERDRKSTRLNSSHQISSYAVSCLKKKGASRSTCRGGRSVRRPAGAGYPRRRGDRRC